DDMLHLLSEPETSDVAVQIVARHPEWATEIVEFGEAIAPSPQAWYQVVGSIGPSMIADVEFQAHLGALMARDDSAAAGAAFEAIINSPGKVAMNERWSEPIAKSLRSAVGADLDQVFLAIAKLETTEFDETIQALSDDPSLPTRSRFLALRATSKGANLSEAGFELLIDLLVGVDSSPADRAQATAMLSEVRLTKDQLLILADVVPSVGPVDLPGILAAFARDRDPEVGKALAEAIIDAPGASSVPAMELSRTFTRYPPEIGKIVQPRIEELLSVERSRVSRLERLASLALSQGDAERGKLVFDQGLGACNTCHLIGDSGRDVGPNLTTIGRIRTPRDLLESILFPGGSLARDFEAYSFEMRDGQLHMGIVREETPSLVKIVAAGGAEIELSRAEVKSMKPAPTSLMPLGLDQSMTEQQLLDLVAYLDGLE
ncbi:MAG: hypothetical protein AAF585_15450, partial [Verrucomicrobiota bacterium]